MDPEKMVYFNYPSQKKLTGKIVKILIGIVISVPLVGACSQVPDAINPSEWYKGTLDYFSSEDSTIYETNKKSTQKGPNEKLGKAPLDSDDSFPNLASVDQQARARDVIGGGLPADSERPEYAPAIKRQRIVSAIDREKNIPTRNPITVPKPKPMNALPLASPEQPAPPAMPKPFVAQIPAPSQLNVKNSQQTQKIVSAKIKEGQENSRNRLVSQLAEIRSRVANRKTAPMMVRPFPRGGDDISTIIISSQGVIVNEGAGKRAQRFIPTEPSATSISSSRLKPSQSGALSNEIKVATIFYDNGSYRLKANDKKILNAVARLQRKDGGQFRIVGHASSRTRNLTPVKHKMVNFKISIDRADKIASTLVQLGVSKNNIQIAAVSDTQPAYYEFMLSGEAGNRRTEIFLTR
jgi:outer membrane protein OmpA-like peptidoglycan-associated protein